MIKDAQENAHNLLEDSKHSHQVVDVGQIVCAVSMETWVAAEIPSGDHPEPSNQPPAALPDSVNMEWVKLQMIN